MISWWQRWHHRKSINNLVKQIKDTPKIDVPLTHLILTIRELVIFRWLLINDKNEYDRITRELVEIIKRFRHDEISEYTAREKIQAKINYVNSHYILSGRPPGAFSRTFKMIVGGLIALFVTAIGEFQVFYNAITSGKFDEAYYQAILAAIPFGLFLLWLITDTIQRRKMIKTLIQEIEYTQSRD